MKQRFLVRNHRVRVNGRRLTTRHSKSVAGGSIGGQRDDLFRQEEMKQSLPKGELGQSNMDATIKRNLIHKKQVLAKVLPSRNNVIGGTMMSQDPLESVRLPKFVNGKKMNRNNIKISL